MKVLEKYIKLWQWDKNKIYELDNFVNWPINKLIDFDNNLKKIMLQNFVDITGALKTKNISSIISESDMTVIARKLMSYYFKKKSKLQYYYFSFEDSYFEDNISIIFDRENNIWKSYRKKYDKNIEDESGILFQSRSLSELCTWLAYNNIYKQWKSAVKFYCDYPINTTSVFDFLAFASEFFNKENISFLKSNSFYLEQSFVIRTIVTFNFGQYKSDNLNDITIVYLNSWGELYCEKLNNYTELMAYIRNSVEGFVKIGHMDKFDNAFKIFNYEGNAIYSMSLKNLIESMTEFFFKKKWLGIERKIFITEIENNFYSFYLKHKDFRVFSDASNVKLFEDMFLFQNEMLYFGYDSKNSKTNMFGVLFDKLEFSQNQIFFLNYRNYYIWMFFDENNLPVIGGIEKNKINKFISTFNLFFKNTGKNCEYFELKLNMNQLYYISKINFIEEQINDSYLFEVEYNFDGNLKFDDYKNAVVNTLTGKYNFANETEIEDFFKLYKKNTGFEFFSVIKIKLNNFEKPQMSILVKIKNKIEKFIFTRMSLSS